MTATDRAGLRGQKIPQGPKRSLTYGAVSMGRGRGT